MSNNSENEQPQDSDPGRKVTNQARSRRGRSIFGRLLLLLIIIGGLAAGGWFGWQWLDQVRSYHVGQLDAQREDIRELRSELQSLRETTVDVTAFTETQDAIATSQDALRDQVDSLATSVEDLRDAAQGGRRDLLQAEIEFLLRIAADELYLTGDVNAAMYALRSADERLHALEAPRLNPVRERIAEHLTDLNAIAVPDTTGMALKLASLMRGVKDLPLAQSEHARQQQEQVERPEAEGGWWQGVKAGTQRLFARLVTVDDAEPPAPLLQPDEHFFLYRNLELQFAAARAALLQGDVAVYRQSLETAREWLNEYYDTSNAQVAGVLDDINGLLAVSLQPDLPDISGALQTYRDLTSDGVRR